ncbi:MAG TPA: hypothetical protein VJY62_10230 [Bacteroidia bacterium]|nr:hypothetical protein [Bacteroidia bacterium]
MKRKQRKKFNLFSFISTVASGSCMFLLCINFSTLKAQISVPNTTPVTENFNGMGASATASLPANWKMAAPGIAGTATWSAGTNVTATLQQASSGAPVTGSRYNWATTGGADRSPGFMTSGSYANPNCIMAYYQNNTGLTITDVTISFQVERYRINTAVFVMTFFTSLDGNSWTWETAGDISGLVFPVGASSYTFAAPQTAVRSFTLPSVNIPNGNGYYLKWILFTSGTNSQGIGLDDVSLTASTCAPLSITTQPLASSVCAGNNTSFTITAAGPTGYQWQEYNGTVWNNLSNGGVYSNVTTATLNLTGVTAGLNNYQYRCVTTNGCSFVTSNAALLNVGAAFSITSQPSNAVTCIGSNTSFTVATTAGATAYQWQVSTDGGLTYSNLSNGAPYSNVTATTLDITGASAGLNNNLYQCVITNGGCTAPVTSNAAMLTAGGPTFILNPGNAAACNGNSASFTVLTTGGAPTYVWEYSINGGVSWNPVPNAPPYTGFNTATLTINPAVLAMNNYQYRSVVTDAGCPSTSTSAVLTVSSGPVIFTQPSNVITPAGTNATFTVNAVNTVSYQWEESTNGGVTWTALSNLPPYSGVTTAAMTISGVTAAMNGYMYHCILGGCASSLTSNAGTLIIGVTGGTVLLPGDMVIVGYDSKVGTGVGCNTGAATDRYYLMNMVDLLPGTKFKIVNSRFESGATAGVRTNRWYGSGNDPYQDPAFAAFTWNGLTSITKGSIITVNVSGDIPNSVISNIAISGIATASFSTAGSTGACNISSSAPDQIFLVQGDFIGLGTYSVNRYNVFTGKVLFGMTNAAPWVPLANTCSAGTANSDRVSRLPDDIECFNLEFTTNRDVYYYLNSSLHNGSQRQLLGAIMNTANWTQPGNTTCLDVPEDFSGAAGASAGKQFTFIAGNPPGYWVGDFNTDWFNCRNWESFTVPDPTVDVTIPVANIPAGAINNSRIDVVLYATTAAKYLNVAQCKNLTVSGRSLIIEGNINNKLVSFGNFIFPVGGTGTFDMDDGNNAVADGQFYLIGNWTNQLSETNFSEGNSTVYFLGSGTQTITTSLIDKNENYYNVSLDNPAGFTIDGDVTVKGNMNMINGVVTPVVNATDEVVFTDNATVTNLSASSYVSGKVRKIGNDAFIFPTGKGGKWARIAMAVPASATSAFQAEYFKAGYGIYTVNPPLDHISIVEYWNLLSIGTASNVNDVTLYWEDAFFSGITGGPLSPNLRVAYYTPVWDDKGAAGLFILGNTGHLTSSIAPVSAFGSFTFGSLIPDIPLPVELISFTAKAVDNKKAELTWITASEINNDYFTVLRSKDGFNFESIGRVEGNGTTTSASKYNFTDEMPFKGASFYKLLQTDFNNQVTESEIRTINISAESNFGIGHVTSFENILSFELFSNDKLENVSVELFDLRGRIVYKAADYSGDNQKLYKISTADFNHSVYFLKVKSNAGIALVKVML